MAQSNQLPSKEMLIEQQRKNLEFVERWAGSMPKVNGVAIVKALTYDLIQIVNRLGMGQ